MRPSGTTEPAAARRTGFAATIHRRMARLADAQHAVALERFFKTAGD